jgi:hypothetical protein
MSSGKTRICLEHPRFWIIPERNVRAGDMLKVHYRKAPMTDIRVRMPIRDFTSETSCGKNGE